MPGGWVTSDIPRVPPVCSALTRCSNSDPIAQVPGPCPTWCTTTEVLMATSHNWPEVSSDEYWYGRSRARARSRPAPTGLRCAPSRRPPPAGPCWRPRASCSPPPGTPRTTVADVARLAGVSVDTVYTSVGRKPELLLAVHDMALGGGDEPCRARTTWRPGRPGAAELETYAPHWRAVPWSCRWPSRCRGRVTRLPWCWRACRRRAGHGSPLTERASTDVLTEDIARRARASSTTATDAEGCQQGCRSTPSTPASRASPSCCWPCTTWLSAAATSSVAAEGRDYVAAIRAARGARAKLETYAAALAQRFPRSCHWPSRCRRRPSATRPAVRCWRGSTPAAPRTCSSMAADLRSTGEVRPDLTDEQVAHLLWTTNSAAFYRLATSGGRGRGRLRCHGPRPVDPHPPGAR